MTDHNGDSHEIWCNRDHSMNEPCEVTDHRELLALAAQLQAGRKP